MNVYALNIYSERVSSYELKSISGRSALNRLSIAREQNGNYSGTNSANRKKTRNKSTSALAGNLPNLSDDALLAGLEALRGKDRKIRTKAKA